jgi:phage terminase large subunit-like protein
LGLRGIGGKDLRKAGAKPAKRRPKWKNKRLSRAGRVIAFIEGLRITAGTHAGKPFKLRPWQREIVESIYATDATGKRIKRQALVCIPRKNGKSALAAALALCHLCGPEAEQRGQVYSAAADRDQAALIFREMIAFIQADESMSARIVIRSHAKTLEDLESGSIYSALSSDARKAHGLSPSFVVADELAQWKGRELYDNLLTGFGARSEPLMVVISTQSPDANHVMTELVRYGEQINAGEIEDKSFHATVHAAAPNDDPFDETVWHRCNPALGDFRSLEEFRIAAEQARRIPARRPAFELLYLNRAIDAETAFIARGDWEACAAEIDANSLHGTRCILGLDLSSTTDLTALAAHFPDSGDLLCWGWLPADGLAEAEKRDHAPYTLWARQGVLETTPGRSIDREFVVQRIAEICELYDVQCMFADRWRLDEVARLIDAQRIKLKIEGHGFGWKDMNPSIDAFEAEVLAQRLRHDSPLLNMAMANAKVLSDPAGNRKLVKNRSYGRIDPLIAAVLAVGGAKRAPEKMPSVYTKRGILLF